MLELAAFGGLVALDNVRAAFALGMIDLSRARRSSWRSPSGRSKR
jgi:hypothetical protein